MPIKKPNTFQNEPKPLDGSEELYTQTSGVNSKFQVSDIWNSQPFSVGSSGETITNSSVITINNQQTIVNSIVTGSTVSVTGSTVMSGDTAFFTDNQDGTYTFENNVDPDLLITPANYKTSLSITGEKWVVGNYAIIRQVIQLAQWTLGTENNGFIQLNLIPNAAAIVRLGAFCKYTKSGSDYVNNIQFGDGEPWQGKLYMNFNNISGLYDLVWEDLLSTNFIIDNQPEVYFIIEFAKP